MSEEDLEVLITLDDPGEDTLDEDRFHDGKRPDQPAEQDIWSAVTCHRFK